jgi:hypothetical protein
MHLIHNWKKIKTEIIPYDDNVNIKKIFWICLICNKKKTTEEYEENFLIRESKTQSKKGIKVKYFSLLKTGDCDMS